MIHDFWLDAMLNDASRRRSYQRELLAARRQPCRPRTYIKGLLGMARAARHCELQSAARLRQSYQEGAI
ncbi:hypothetical protein ACYHQE_003123 [Aeromonas salmonicida]|uniref:hypothetical protein n=1 Tax=Aeromonas salmonicida TaxID=645 RepID=UPI0038BCD861